MRGESGGLKAAASGPLSKPLSIEDLGVSRPMLVDLAVKLLYAEGELDGAEIADRFKIPLPVAVDILDVLRREKLCSVLGSDRGVVPVYRYGITELGVERAREALSRNE